jgi:drug/metabolite transporter (DMT)-like permease
MAGAGRMPKHLVAGALLQGLYVGGGYWAVSHGLSPAVMALLGTLQPMVTALIAQRLFAERVGRRFWGGLLAGVTGVLLVLSPRLALADGDGLPPPVIAVALLSVAAITAGTLVQKTSLAAANLISASAVQYAGGALVVAIAAWLLGESLWRPGVALWGALAWAVLLLSGVATTLLVWMVRRGSAARVTVLLLLAPPLAARAGVVAVRRASGHTADRRLRTRTRWRAAVPSRHGWQSMESKAAGIRIADTTDAP